MIHFAQTYNNYLHAFEGALAAKCDAMRFTPPVLAESMRYSLLAGGKRIRPVLFFAALDAFGMPYEKEGDFAVALECIHTYSLIHDDLPAMDNDDFRRGMPSNHKRFGEGNAILAGDALLSFAFDLLLAQCTDERHRMAAQAISRAAGAEGMIAGQSADLFYEGKSAGAEELDFIVKGKTARLIAAPIVAATILAGKQTGPAEAFGTHLGVLFQITDDLLDEKGDAGKIGKTPGKDREENKLTYVKIYGAEGAERIADERMQLALRALDDMDGDKAFFAELVRFIRRREK